MTTPGQLVQGMATALGLPKETVTVFDRHLSEAGFRTKGGRGRSAARVTARDAANLLVAILMSFEIADAPKMIEIASYMVVEKIDLRHNYSNVYQQMKQLAEKDNANFLDIIEKIIQEAAENKPILTNGTIINGERGTPFAWIDLTYMRIDFSLSQNCPKELSEFANRFMDRGLSISAQIGAEVLIEIANLFMTD